MTKKQAIREANKLAKNRMSKTWYVVYDDEYESLYGSEDAWTVCSEGDYHKFYSNHVPIIITNA